MIRLILKARAGLTRKVITNKAGKKQTVYVRTGKKQSDQALYTSHVDTLVKQAAADVGMTEAEIRADKSFMSMIKKDASRKVVTEGMAKPGKFSIGGYTMYISNKRGVTLMGTETVIPHHISSIMMNMPESGHTAAQKFTKQIMQVYRTSGGNMQKVQQFVKQQTKLR